MKNLKNSLLLILLLPLGFLFLVLDAAYRGRKRLASLLLAALVILSQAGLSAFAQENTSNDIMTHSDEEANIYSLILDTSDGKLYPGTVNINNSYNLATTPIANIEGSAIESGNAALGPGSSYSWNDAAGTLSINNISWVTSASVALYIPANATLVLLGQNHIISEFSGADITHSTGLFCKGKLTLEGSGSLTVSGGDSTYTGTQNRSYGIVGLGGVEISGGTIRAESGSLQSSSGISVAIFGYTKKTLITGGNITATGGAAHGESSGISADGGTVVDGGIVLARGGSYGVYAYLNVATLKSGTITAIGGKQAMGDSGSVDLSGDSYRYWTNTSASDPGGDGYLYTLGGDVPAFSYSSEYKYISIIIAIPGADIETAPTAGVVTENSITVNAATLSDATGQDIEYALGTDVSMVPDTGWQTDLTFGGLTPDTEYYIWARSKANDNCDAGNAEHSGLIRTKAIYTVSYNLNGGEGSFADQAKIQDTHLQLHTGVPTKNNFTFTGWNTAIDASGYSYDAGGQYTLNMDATLYAQWSAVSYTITYENLQGGIHDNPGGYTAENESIILRGAERDGYSFTGWYSALNGGALIESIPAGSSGNVVLYARWAKLINTATLSIAPVTGASPQSDAQSAGEYSGSISWSPEAGDAFAPLTVYTASVRLVAADGAVFADGFAPDVTGGNVKNLVISGNQATFDVEFPETSARSITGIAVHTDPALEYMAGDRLDLSGLVLEISYTYGEPERVAFDQLAGLSAQISGSTVTNGGAVTSVYHNKAVALSYGGHTASTAFLSVHTPPVLQLNAATGISSNSALISGAVAAGSDNYDAIIQYYDGQSWETADSKLNCVSDSALSASLSGLDANSAYRYRLTVTAWGREYTLEKVFRTTPLSPQAGWTISGQVTDSSTPGSVLISLERGNTAIAGVAVSGSGTYDFSFSNISNGVYNIVINNGSYAITRAVEVSGGDIGDIKISMGAGNTQSIVEVSTDKTPDISADGLHGLFGNSLIYTDADKTVVNEDGTVEIKLRAMHVESPVDAGLISAIAGGQTLGLYIDLSIHKTVMDKTGIRLSEEQLTNLGGYPIVIMFELPENLKGKNGIEVYRVHGNTAEKLSKNASAEEFFELRGNTVVLHISKFSTYAIGYTPESSHVENPKDPPGGVQKPGEDDGGDKDIVDSIEDITGHWGYDAVVYMLANMYMEAGDDTHFYPNSPATRAEVAQVIYRVMGAPDVSGLDNPFTDIRSSHKNYNAILWCNENKIMIGVGDKRFEPDRVISRQEIATALSLFANNTNQTLPQDKPYTPFADNHQIDAWAEAHVHKLRRAGVVNGTPEGEYQPKRATTRAEVAQMIKGLLERLQSRA